MVSVPLDSHANGASCGVGDSSACNWPTDEAELRRLLTPEQFEIVRRNGTEPPFRNAFWDKHDPGLYVDIVSGEALFCSTDKFNSGTGWPSFTRPVDDSAVTRITDRSHGMARVEVRSRRANSHLGHVFDDGPEPTGLRYCINSGALRFVPARRLSAEGYGAWARLFPGVAQEPGPVGAAPLPTTDTIIFGAGCFWGTEGYFKRLAGVLQTDVGYAGGRTSNPTYEQVCAGLTGHAEVLRVVFDPAKISLETLLRHFLRMHEPTVRNRQGNDVGTQYRSIVIVRNAAQQEVTRAVLGVAQSRYTRPIVTEVVRSEVFYAAEDYHQDYLDKNPGGYCHVNLGLAAQPLD